MTTRNSIFLGLAILVLGLGMMACTKTEVAKFEPPTYYSEEAINTARELINAGYTLLGEDSLDAAVAKFAQVGDYVSPAVMEYHTACAYGRTGNSEEAFENLTSMLDRGFDKPDDLLYDSDFESLRSDTRFDALVEKAKANYAAGTAGLAGGLPVYETPPITFATEEEYTTWIETETRRLRLQRSFWTSSQFLSGQADLTARQLAALEPLKADDPEYDAGLARVRAAAGLKSSYEKGWGAISDMVVHEAQAYFAGSPTEAGKDEVNYRTGYAASMKYSAEDDERTKGYTDAVAYLEEVSEESDFYSAAQGMMIINELNAPDVDETAAGNEFKALISKFPEDDKLYRVIATQTNNTAAQYLWPLTLEIDDVHGKTVSIDEYRGKALLIDFWATWCPPCRAELPNLVEIYNQYHDKGLEIVSISLDYPERITTDGYLRWIDSAGMDWRHTYDGLNWGTPPVKKFYVGSIPAPFLVGPDGSLAAMGEDLRGEELENTIKATLGL